MGTLTNSEDPDEMPHDAAFHQGLHCKGKNNSQGQKCIIIEMAYPCPLKIYNGHFHLDCFYFDGKIH